ncbi:hypothetical protein PUG81_07250 [Erwiniaceae bacterium L1_54_6]|nr:hypothetical protein [Erwiniaceae bacterium L1_54_6]
MNTTPVASTSWAATSSLAIESEHNSQVAENVISIDNSAENLSSFEILLQHTFTYEILVEILRRRSPTLQVSHPWQYLLPQPYAQLLACSTKQPNASNFHTLIALLPLIPHDWQYDAINAICENFIKRIENFPAFSAVIDFLITSKEIDSHSFQLMVYSLISRIGRFNVNEEMLQENHSLPPPAPANLKHQKENNATKIAELEYQKDSLGFDIQRQDKKKKLFLNEIKIIQWKIKNIKVDSDDIEKKKLKEQEGNRLNGEVKNLSREIAAINRKKAQIDRADIDRLTKTMSYHESFNITNDLVKDINLKINLLNNSNRNITEQTNRFVFEIIASLLCANTVKIPENAMEKIKIKLVDSLGKLSINQRYPILCALIKSEICSVPVLATLAQTLNDGFYEFSYAALRLVAGKMEEYFNNGEDVSHIISTLRACVENKPDDESNWWNDIDSLSHSCQKILRDHAVSFTDVP